MIIPLIKRHVSLISLTFALALVVCNSSGAQCPPFRIFNGETIADEFGKSVASAGDVNLDDYDDIIIGAPYNDDAGSDAGKAYVFSGRNGDTLYTFAGEAAGDFFGKSVASAGDIDLDGFDDLFVAAPRNNAGGSNAGRAYVFSGKTGALIYMFTGEVAGDLFGTSISIAKVNHDNYYDLIIGAPRNDASGFDAGRVYVFSGKTGLLLYTLDGEATGDLFGSSVSGAGDGGGHGHPILIGAPGNSAGGADAGRAYLYAAGTTSPALTFTGPSAGVRFGISVSGGGAINNELRFRVIIGASGPQSLGPYSGRAYVYDKLTAALIYTFTGDSGGDNFGVSVSGIGDVNSDGVDDMVVGATGNDAGGINSGKAYVYSGLTGTRLNIITGESPGDFLGASVSGAGNTNKDDLAEVIIGAPGRAAGATTSGRAYLSFGKKCGEVIRVPQDRATIQAGLDIAVTNDTVLVDDGTYSGVGNRFLDFRGKNMILKSKNGPDVTVIDCNKFGRGLHFHSGEDTTALVEGFTIRNGFVKQLCTFIECFPSKGGGIYCVNSSPTISNNVITLCEADYGAGIACST
ncbi:MAG: FG-GAP repeat protein, partial [candidate division Zixibacteria bacterium]|nr:FG-GAP repeat protein [candidate division Zixibacteria bacterium]